MLADGWYGGAGHQEMDPFVGWIRSRWWARRLKLPHVADRVGWVRGALLWIGSISYDAVLVERAVMGWRTLLVLRAVTGRRKKLVAFHFAIDPVERFSPGPRGVVERAWIKVDRWATRRALRAAQVLTPPEAEIYAWRYGVESDRFRFVPFALRSDRVVPRAPAVPGRAPVVISAGQSFCDWETLFSAARGARWPLVVMCSATDLPTVERLNQDGRATIHCDLPYTEAMAILAKADISAIVMRDARISQGQVRVLNAADNGLAVVASRVAGLAGYVSDGDSGLLVPVGDDVALRAAIGRLVDDEALRASLVSNARRRGEEWTWSRYVNAIASLAAGRVDVEGQIPADWDAWRTPGSARVGYGDRSDRVCP